MSRAVQRSKTRARREIQMREVARVRDYCIKPILSMGISTARSSAVQTPREIHILSATLCRPSFRGRSFPFSPLFYFSFHRDLSLPLSLFLARENSSTFHAAPPASLSLFPSRSLARSLARFPRGVKGRDPGATVSKYDTGIGYKETINHSRARANGIRTASE